MQANHNEGKTMKKQIRVTFRSYSTVLKKEFANVEDHFSIADARLRALALNFLRTV